MYELYSRRFFMLKLIFWFPYWVDLGVKLLKFIGTTFSDPSTPSRGCHFHLEAPLYTNPMALSANNEHFQYDRNPSLKLHNYLVIYQEIKFTR